ncbi:immunoglobulin V-set domain protein [Oesophagostomum dentatum]|uniref:Immunoglobulin V-set domain protein n=1 Tax=Oesophagostomum dentatum TaxID=61180 RepID=A0A0B1TNT0_OESDE|nr:immunoglobulin V-set domain protein [Oesophagostomum dentatum]
MFCFFLLLYWAVFVSGEQAIVEGPQESYVFLGQTIVLKCKVKNQKGAVQWMKNGFGLGVDRQLKFFPRYSMIGSASRGEYNLQITNTTVGDDDIYACQISEAASEPAVASNPAKLTVLRLTLYSLSLTFLPFLASITIDRARLLSADHLIREQTYYICLVSLVMSGVTLHRRVKEATIDSHEYMHLHN